MRRWDYITAMGSARMRQHVCFSNRPIVEKAVKAARASLLYLPKYSPDLNPIEQAFSKLKALLRKAAERTVPGLWRRIGKLLATFSARECKNYFKHAGYAST